MKRRRWERKAGVSPADCLAGWRAAARGAHADGRHDEELRCRNVARLMQGLPALAPGGRCVDGSKS